MADDSGRVTTTCGCAVSGSDVTLDADDGPDEGGEEYGPGL